MSELKTDDKVFLCDKDNGEYAIGIVEITDDHKDESGNFIEADFTYTNGTIVSPVSTECCHKISDDLYAYVEKLEQSLEQTLKIAEKWGYQHTEQ